MSRVSNLEKRECFLTLTDSQRRNRLFVRRFCAMRRVRHFLPQRVCRRCGAPNSLRKWGDFVTSMIIIFAPAAVALRRWHQRSMLQRSQCAQSPISLRMQGIMNRQIAPNSPRSPPILYSHSCRFECFKNVQNVRAACSASTHTHTHSTRSLRVRSLATSLRWIVKHLA